MSSPAVLKSHAWQVAKKELHDAVGVQVNPRGEAKTQAMADKLEAERRLAVLREMLNPLVVADAEDTMSAFLDLMETWEGQDGITAHRRDLLAYERAATPPPAAAAPSTLTSAAKTLSPQQLEQIARNRREAELRRAAARACQQ